MTKPSARIIANGQDITTKLLDPQNERATLVSLTVTDEAGTKADSLELVLDNREFFVVPPVGSTIEVFLGYEPAPARMGTFRLDHWELGGPPDTLTLSATSAEMTTEIKGQKTRSWHDTTLGEVVRKIAGEHGLGNSVDSELGGRAVAHIDQQTESDINFLSRLAKRNGAVFKLADGKVVFAQRGIKGPGAKAARTIKPGEVSSWRVSESERGGHKSVIATWHDHTEGKRKSATAGSGKPAHRLKTVYPNEAEAKAAAAATMADLKRGKRDGTIEMPGTTNLFAGDELKLAGFHPAADGTYGVSTVTHTLDSSGYRTSVSLEVGGGDSE